MSGLPLTAFVKVIISLVTQFRHICAFYVTFDLRFELYLILLSSHLNFCWAFLVRKNH